MIDTYTNMRWKDLEAFLSVHDFTVVHEDGINPIDDTDNTGELNIHLIKTSWKQTE